MTSSPPTACPPPSRNFEYLVEKFPVVADHLKWAEVLAPLNAPAAATKLRCMLEEFVREVLGGGPKHQTLFDSLKSRRFEEAVGDSDLRELAWRIKSAGNDGAHGRRVRDIEQRLADAAQLASFLYMGHGGGDATEVPEYSRSEGIELQAAERLLAANSGSELMTTGDERPSHAVAESEPGFYESHLDRFPLATARRGSMHLVRGATSTTVLVEHDGEVEVLWRDIPMLLFGADRELWEWAKRTSWTQIGRVSDFDDEEDDERPDFKVLAPIDDPRLINLSSGESLPPHAIPKFDDDPVLQHTRERRPLLSVGPWHLQYTNDFTYYAGRAHGGWTCRFDVHRLGASLGSVTCDVIAAHFLSDPQRAAALAASWTADGETEEEDYFSEEPELTLFEFCFTADGRVGLRYQWTRDFCYAGSDGEWDSYTVSRHLISYDLPSCLGLDVIPPAAVRAWWRAHPDGFCGWSTLDVGMVTALRGRLEFEDGV